MVRPFHLILEEEEATRLKLSKTLLIAFQIPGYDIRGLNLLICLEFSVERSKVCPPWRLYCKDQC